MIGSQVPSPQAGTAREPLTLDDIQQRLTDRFPGTPTNVANGQLTLFIDADRLVEVLRFCRDDDELSCELLSNLSGVHWPVCDHVVERQPSTTGWPQYRLSRDRGVIEVGYVLRSVSRNHWFGLSVAVDDEAPRLPSATGVYETADWHEREVYDFFGVEFDGHPNLTRILMPDDWVGHPHRKDYPIGGVDIPYKNDRFIPPPEERDLRELVE